MPPLGVRLLGDGTSSELYPVATICREESQYGDKIVTRRLTYIF